MSSSASPLIKQLAHVCLYSSDLRRTEDFYCGVLGLSVQFRFMRNGELFGYYLRIAETQFIEIFARAEPSVAEHPPIGHLCLEVKSVAAVHEHLAAAGIEVTEPKLGADHSWQCWCKDPDGTSIEFHEYTPESCQRTGRVCALNW